MSWSQWIEGARLAAAAALLVVLTVPVKAEENPACSTFEWPLAMERSWFEAGNLQDLQSGAAVGKLAEGAFTVSLKPSAEIGFALPPKPSRRPASPWVRSYPSALLQRRGSIR